MPDESNPPGGRKPPPVEYRFVKGRSGNPRGRPPNSMSLSNVTPKIAMKKISVTYGGVAKYQTVIEHIFDTLKREAARGIPAMIELLEQIYHKLSPPADNRPGGFLIVPETLTHAVAIAQMNKHNATARDPSLPLDPKSARDRLAAAQMQLDPALAELEKARQGFPSPLGQAMLAYQRKWRQIYNPAIAKSRPS